MEKNGDPSPRICFGIVGENGAQQVPPLDVLILFSCPPSHILEEQIYRVVQHLLGEEQNQLPKVSNFCNPVVSHITNSSSILCLIALILP